MGSVKGAARLRNPGKQSFLPPKSPFPSIAASAYGDYGFGGNRGSQNLREGNRHHQRTSSESFLIEEQPSWLDDLLNEPETPARRGAHRRSSSDSLTYLDGAYVCSNMYNLAEEECRQRKAMPSWGSQEFDQLRDAQHYFPEGNQFGRNSFDRQQSRVWESALNVGKYSNSVLAANERGLHPGSFDTKPMEPETFASLDAEKPEQEESLKDSNTGLGKKEASQANHSPSESDTKRVKQQFAQRSRVRKLQYIAELEKSVQALQAEGLEVSAELEFLDQQNLILNLENKALKQRLDSLAQEQLVKCLQQEILEREIARLRLLLQQQQPPPTQQVPPSHARTRSRDLDSQFANMSLNHKEAMSSYLKHNAQK